MTIATSIEDARIGALRVPQMVLHAGEVVGIAGALGAGQTQLLETLAGARRASRQGRYRVNGVTGCPAGVPQAIERGVYLVAAERLRQGLFPGLAVAQNLASGALARLCRYGFMQDGRIAAAARRAIGELRIQCRDLAQDVLELSGGNQQKLAFGRWLIRMAHGERGKRPLLLLDNSTEGMDVASQAEIHALIRALAQSGASVLIASPEFAEMLKLCDRIYCIADGALGRCLARAEFSEARLLLEVS